MFLAFNIKLFTHREFVQIEAGPVVGQGTGNLLGGVLVGFEWISSGGPEVYIEFPWNAKGNQVEFPFHREPQIEPSWAITLANLNNIPTVHRPEIVTAEHPGGSFGRIGGSNKELAELKQPCGF